MIKDDKLIFENYKRSKYLSNEVSRRWDLIDALNKVKLPFSDDKEAEREIVYNLTVKYGLRESDGPIRSIVDEVEYQFQKARNSVKK